MKQYKHTQTGTIATEIENEYSYKFSSGGNIHKSFIENTLDWTLIDEKKIGWLINKVFFNWITYSDGNKSYGISIYGDWFNLEGSLIDETDIPSTPGNTLKMLSEYATKMGYKEGVKVVSVESGKEWKLTSNYFRLVQNNLYLNDICIMKDGIWATIIKQHSHFTPEQRDEILLMIDNKLNK